MNQDLPCGRAAHRSGDGRKDAAVGHRGCELVVSDGWRDPLEAREGLRQRVCGAKPAFGVKAAHRHAEQLRRAGQDVSAYRCVFCRCWHVGPVPSMETIEALARVIRGLTL